MLQHTVPMHSGEQDAATNGSQALRMLQQTGHRQMLQYTDHRHFMLQHTDRRHSMLQQTGHRHSCCNTRITGTLDVATHGSHALWRARCCNTRITCTLEGKMLQHTDHMHSGGQDAATHGSHALWRARCCNTRFPCTLESKMLQHTDHMHSGELCAWEDFRGR